MKTFFFAITIPFELAELISRDWCQSEKISFFDAKNYHITVFYMGKLSQSTISNVIENVDLLYLQSFTIKIEGISIFYTGDKIETIALDIKAGRMELTTIHNKLIQASKLNLLTEKPFRPHMTLIKGSVNKQIYLEQYLQNISIKLSYEFIPDKLYLLDSSLAHVNKHYKILNFWNFI